MVEWGVGDAGVMISRYLPRATYENGNVVGRYHLKRLSVSWEIEKHYDTPKEESTAAGTQWGRHSPGSLAGKVALIIHPGLRLYQEMEFQDEMAEYN